ncbi:MAG: hypothetical protein WBK91_04060 [Alphaproteobacteria bacterium]
MNFIAPLREAELTGIALRNVTVAAVKRKPTQKAKPPRARKDKGLGGQGKAASLLSTPERRAKAGGVVQELIPVDDPKSRAVFKRHRAAAECWLDRYALVTPKRRALLNAEEHDAGMELRRAWLFLLHGIRWAHQDSTQAECIDGGGSKGTLSERLEYSERIIRDFYAAGLSHAQKLVILRVCLDDQSAGDKDKAQTLKRGLQRMIEYWRRGRPVTSAASRERLVELSRGIDKLIADNVSNIHGTHRKLALKKSA